VDRREGAEQLGQVEAKGTDALDEAVHEEVEGVERPPVRRPEGDEGPRHLPAAEHLEEVAGHEAAHGVAQEHQLGLLLARPLPVLLQPHRCLLGQAMGGGPVVTAPVVGEVEPVHAVDQVELLEQALLHLAVPVDLPEPGQQVDVGHEAGGPDAVAQVELLGVVVVEAQLLHAAPERRQATPGGAGRHGPHVSAVSLEDAAEDPGQHDDHVVDRLLLRHRHLLRPGRGPRPRTRRTCPGRR
jgi:hypothetical protein